VLFPADRHRRVVAIQADTLARHLDVVVGADGGGAGARFHLEVGACDRRRAERDTPRIPADTLGEIARNIDTQRTGDELDPFARNRDAAWVISIAAVQSEGAAPGQ
jgi:hypothetical protein